MRKMVWSKFRFFFKCTGKYEKNCGDHSADSLSINGEYVAAHRTNSYIEMLGRIEAQLRRRSLDRLTSSSPLLPLHTRLSDYLLEPPQETLISLINGSNLHPLIISYFHASFEACNTSELLLRSIHEVRANYKIIQGVIKLTNGIEDYRTCTSAQFQAIFDELASFSVRHNPLMTIKSAQFRDIHNAHGSLLRRLSTKSRNLRRKESLMRHLGIRRSKLKTQGTQASLNERLQAELESAAKGVFIMINEFDTMSRLVKRLQEEIEHIKDIADMCVRKEKSEVLIEVVKEFEVHGTPFLEQLKELEEHVHLCFLTINRSRMLVMQEIMALQDV